MTEVETKVETWNEWEDTWKELIDLKKEMAERIVDKMWEKYNDLLLQFWKWKDLIADYLVDEWWEDVVDDLWAGLSINLFSWYKEQLKDLRDDIKKAESKEALADLEARIINNLENGTQWDIAWWKSTQENVTTAWVVAISTSSATIPSSNENYNPNIKVSVDFAPVWEAKEISPEKRMEWLFPAWVPQTKKQMQQYIEKIEVPIRNPKWKEKSLKLSVHKKLANEYKAIFQEMFDRWIPVNPKKTACFNRRKMRKWKKMSHHSYASAIDINWDVNGWVYGKTDKNSIYYNDQAMVDIRKKHGFYRWWDRSKNSNDPMHFTYTEFPKHKDINLA